jgi:3-oxo-5-alpha-steroid 4-dehydrogenase 1
VTDIASATSGHVGHYGVLLWVMLGSTVATVAGTMLVTAPYGRHLRAGWGPTLPSRLGWLVMESPAVGAFLLFYARGENRGAPVPLVLLGLWQVHYVNRTLVYPFRLPGRGRSMPLSIAGLAFAFNVLNAYLNARWISEFGHYAADWLTSPRFLAGAALMGAGFATNLWADGVLRRLRGPSAGADYKVPRGGLYEWVSCPNYLAEIVEWTGWAIAAWSPAGLLFALYTAANLGPRAVANHRWYRETFPDYPSDRKALVPFVL